MHKGSWKPFNRCIYHNEILRCRLCGCRLCSKSHLKQRVLNHRTTGTTQGHNCSFTQFGCCMLISAFSPAPSAYINKTCSLQRVTPPQKEKGGCTTSSQQLGCFCLHLHLRNMSDIMAWSSPVNIVQTQHSGKKWVQSTVVNTEPIVLIFFL